MGCQFELSIFWTFWVANCRRTFLNFLAYSYLFFPWKNSSTNHVEHRSIFSFLCIVWVFYNRYGSHTELEYNYLCRSAKFGLINCILQKVSGKISSSHSYIEKNNYTCWNIIFSYEFYIVQIWNLFCINIFCIRIIFRIFCRYFIRRKQNYKYAI